ncbi:MAG: tetratricopeptide repeat protein [Planctomycetota bacterium]|nr:tetratricopeptide repeat protein [Planctomycetota bacterium]MDI6787059.1 tetratricopeptide repeat protein [Planctomycetota bacterium]
MIKIIKLIILLVIVLIIALPILLLTNWGLGTAERYVLDNVHKTWAPDYLWYIADVYSWTFRESKAIDTYTKFMDTFPADTRYPSAKFKRADCLAKVGEKEKAIKEFREFAEWYPEHPDAEVAKRRATLLKYAR